LIRARQVTATELTVMYSRSAISGRGDGPTIPERQGGIERIVGRRGASGRPGRVRHWYRHWRIDPLSRAALRHRRLAPDVWPRSSSSTSSVPRRSTASPAPACMPACGRGPAASCAPAS
jgi:hypothetical protein